MGLNISFSGKVVCDVPEVVTITLTAIHQPSRVSTNRRIMDGYFIINLGDSDWLTQDGGVNSDDTVSMLFVGKNEHNVPIAYAKHSILLKYDTTHVNDIILVKNLLC